MDFITDDVVGYLAAFLTTSAFVPQALHTWRTRSVDDVSLGMYLAFTAGIALWLVYGVLQHSWPLFLANAVTLALALGIVGMKLAYGRRQGRPDRSESR